MAMVVQKLFVLALRHLMARLMVMRWAARQVSIEEADLVGWAFDFPILVQETKAQRKER